MIFVNYSNVNAAFVENMTTEVQIMKKGSQEVLYERKKSTMRMAPNSFIAFPISMNGERMNPGEYTAKILVTADDKVKEEWQEDFKITKDEADKFNERDVGLVQDSGFNWKLIVLIVVGFFVTVILVFVVITIIRKRNKSKNSAKSRKGKKNKNA